MRFSSIVLEFFVLTAGLCNFSFGVDGKVAQDDKNIGEHPSSASIGLRMRSSTMTSPSRHHLAVKSIFERNLRPSSLRGIRNGSQNALKNRASIGREALRGLGGEMSEGYQGSLTKARSTAVTAKTAANKHLVVWQLPMTQEFFEHCEGPNGANLQHLFSKIGEAALFNVVDRAIAAATGGQFGSTFDDIRGVILEEWNDPKPVLDNIRKLILAAAPGSAPYFAAFGYCPTWLEQFGITDLANSFATKPNEAVFWSTREDHAEGQPNRNMVAAKTWAKHNGKKTLEMTLVGKYLDSLGMFDSANYPNFPNGPFVLTSRFLRHKMKDAGFGGTPPARDITLASISEAAFTMNCASYYFADRVHANSTLIHSFFENAAVQNRFNPRDDPTNHNPTFFNMEMPTLLDRSRRYISIVFHYSSDCPNRSDSVFTCAGLNDVDFPLQEFDLGIPLLATMVFFWTTGQRLPDYNDRACALPL